MTPDSNLIQEIHAKYLIHTW